MKQAIQVGIVGDFNPAFRSHHATNASLEHGARRLGLNVESRWLPTTPLDGPDAEEVLSGYDGLWISAGSPYQSMHGALRAIEFARTRGRPLLAT